MSGPGNPAGVGTDVGWSCNDGLEGRLVPTVLRETMQGRERHALFQAEVAEQKRERCELGPVPLRV